LFCRREAPRAPSPVRLRAALMTAAGIA
jgi:hypothetical protein